MQQTNFNVPFTIDKIYETLTDAKAGANSDGIYLNRYILTADDKKVYRKVYTENGEQDYEYITCLKVKCPEVKFIGNTFSDDPFTFKGSVRPGEEDNEVYEIEIPGLWGFDAEIKYNQEGFNKHSNVELEDGEDYISITNTCKGLYKFEDNVYYVVDEFKEAEKEKYRFINVTEVTKDDPLDAISSYYYLDGNDYKPCVEILNPFEEYKRIFSISVDTSKEIKAPDTKRVRVNLPSLGKSAQEAWNLLYGEDRRTGIGNKDVLDRNSDLSSLAGIYNNLYDLTGNEVIVPYDDEPNTENIFNEGDNYYYYKKEYDFDAINEEDKITTVEDYNNKRFSEVALISDNRSNIFYQNSNGGYNKVLKSTGILEDRIYYKLTFGKEMFSEDASVTINMKDCFKIKNDIMQPAEPGEVYNSLYSYYQIDMETPSILKNKYMFIPNEFFIYDEKNNQFKTVKEFDNTRSTYYLFKKEGSEENSGTIEVDGVTIPVNLNFTPISSSDIIDPQFYYCFVYKDNVEKLKEKPLYINSFNFFDQIEGDFYLKYIENIEMNSKEYNVDASDNIFIGIPKDYYNNNMVSFSFKNDYFEKNGDGSYSIVRNPQKNTEYYIIKTKEIIDANLIGIYEKNLYYVKNDNVFTIATEEYDERLTYYMPDQLYVTENYLGYKKNQLWDNTINLNSSEWTESVGDSEFNSKSTYYMSAEGTKIRCFTEKDFENLYVLEPIPCSANGAWRFNESIIFEDTADDKDIFEIDFSVVGSNERFNKITLIHKENKMYFGKDAKEQDNNTGIENVNTVEEPKEDFGLLIFDGLEEDDTKKWKIIDGVDYKSINIEYSANSQDSELIKFLYYNARMEDII